MVTQITQGIKISVRTSFEGTYFKSGRLHFAFCYEVSIENFSKDSVQLMSRHWDIFDALQNMETVDGEGVPGERYSYTSGCLLASPFGAMRGYFNMINFTTTRNFRVIVPSFKLSADFALN